MPAAISITLYDAEDQPKKTYERAIIPWGILKKATRLMDQISDPGTNVAKKKNWFKREPVVVRKEEQQMEAISQFVVELFNNQFTVKELESGADVGEIMTVFQTVITRANASVRSNPTGNQLPKKK